MEYFLNPTYLTKLTFTVLLTVIGANLTGCDGNKANNAELPSQDAEAMKSASDIKLAQHAELFSGCYTVTQDEPAQIKVSLLDGGLVMQMKEPKSASRVWDTPEPLELLPTTKVSSYFSIDQDNIDGLIGRPDQLFILAHVKQAYANIDPLLDSQYLGYILQGSNTIYKVVCDEVYSGEPITASPQNALPKNKSPLESKQDHEVGSISIEHVDRVQPQ